MNEVTGPVCNHCLSPLQAGELVCPQCHTLVYAEQLEAMRQQAMDLEGQRDYANAIRVWAAARHLLPADAKQAQWIEARVQELSPASVPTPTSSAARSRWAQRLGPFAPLLILLAKAKTIFFALFKVKFLFSFAAFLGLYWAMFGAWFGLGFAVMILLHEMGHYVEVRRRGLPAEMPVFLPGLGAYVKWHALGVSDEVRAMVSLAGPAAGTAAALVSYAMFLHNGHEVWAALAHTGAWLNLLNLIPVWVLDGAGASHPLDRVGCFSLMVFCGVLFWWTSQPVLLLVAAGFAWQLYKKQQPQAGSLRVQLYFASLLAVLGWMMHATPLAR